MNKPELLTVLVPAFNSGNFVSDSLNSIKDQTFKNYQVIISVDRSDDNTLEVCEEYAKNNPRFSVISQKNRLGWVGNSNALLDMVSTKYAVFAFHDDLLHQTYFEKLISNLELNPNAVNSFSDTLITKHNGLNEHWIYSELDGVNDVFERGLKLLTQRGFWWVPNRGVFRFSMAKKIGGLKIHESGEFSADLPWLFHMALYGDFIRTPQTLCHKFYKAGSLSRSWKYDSISKSDVLASCMRELWIADIPTSTKLKIGTPLMRHLIRLHGGKS